MTTTIYLGSAEESELFPPDPKQTGLASCLLLAVLSLNFVTLPSYIVSRLSMRASVLSYPMVKLGLKPDFDQRNFWCLVLALNPGCKNGLLFTVSMADNCPRWQMSVVYPP